MQHSSQEPARQTDHAPSEIYQFEQQQENTQPPIFARCIAFYANRRQATWRTIVVGIAGIIAIIVPVFFSIIFLSLAEDSPGQQALGAMLSVSIFLFAIFFAEAALCGWMAWRWYSTLLRNREPILVIDHRGITVRRTPMLSGFFIAWNEIESIRVQSFLYKYLCIRARNEKQFLKRFNVFERFNRMSNIILGISPLLVPQIYLDRPVEEIMQRLYYEYTNELSYYRVQLLS